MTLTRFLSLSLLFVLCCTKMLAQQNVTKNPSLNYQSYNPKSTDLKIDRAAYAEKLQGFWLATCIANWTGLVTEMDKIGNIGDIKTGPFYTRADWGQPDQGSIWAAGIPSNLSPTIDFVFADEDTLWGSDDDTDIEYIYQELLLQNQTSMLTGEQIRNGWMKHIKGEEENYLWVSNQKALDLMKSGLVPPATGAPEHNPEYEMIDAQLTTEIFGLYAPGRPDMAVKMATLPIQTTAREESEWISAYYVRLFSLASTADTSLPIKQQLTKMAEQAALELPTSSYPAAMYRYVKGLYASGISWEQARDSVYQRYQVEQLDGYDISSRKMYCNGCFAAGINFASSLVSLFYGEGDLKETIKIGALAGWDSDNPTATWGGLIGFMLGKEGVEKAFGRNFSDKFHIHRTRVNFPNEGIDTFDAMAQKGLWIIDRVVQEELKGGVDLRSNSWYIPKK
ncbi:MAG: ADP-ribosylglycohydrolase family protein [Algoriphagus sp.]